MLRNVVGRNFVYKQNHCVVHGDLNNQNCFLIYEMQHARLLNFIKFKRHLKNNRPSIIHRRTTHDGKDILKGDVDRFNGITVDVSKLVTRQVEHHNFGVILADSIKLWNKDERSCAWLKVPIEYSHLIKSAAEQGFKLHHAEGDYTMLTKWLGAGPSKVPMYATHQLGVSGFVLNERKEEVLMVQDRHRISRWKFPGGYANLGEDISDTAVREVFEETNIRTEFQSILAFRQQHSLPYNFGRSDFYFVCRLKPLTFDIKPCESELVDAQWLKVDDLLASNDHTLLSKRMAVLVQHGLRNGFSDVDIAMEQLNSVFKGAAYKLFHRKLTSSS
ncbi:nucleoside diphosphate-linked moiety X motif 6-like [Antedon mediterranea]|uniref:nucleoside diphosphate-linked moiety X motif 6-like n=1 Tax=Antedon mediterranea TaxID=105859 RepID=UPI003AF4B99A